ncbi:hypothetical protein LC55x_2657 [Lysobacter capsici]|nr:hypothetical protein LC55x_2657 [Lysobacter capsici]
MSTRAACSRSRVARPGNSATAATGSRDSRRAIAIKMSA